MSFQKPIAHIRHGHYYVQIFELEALALVFQKMTVGPKDIGKKLMEFEECKVVAEKLLGPGSGIGDVRRTLKKKDSMTNRANCLCNTGTGMELPIHLLYLLRGWNAPLQSTSKCQTL